MTVLPLPSSFLYPLREFGLASAQPWRAWTNASLALWDNAALRNTLVARLATANLSMFERATRDFSKPQFGLAGTTEVAVWQKPFCRLLHFVTKGREKKPKMLLVAPMSGHYATLLRDTVEAFLPKFDCYVTDWSNARDVPASAGRFDLDDYADYITEMLHHLGKRAHVIAVCQPSVPVMAAVSMMAAKKDKLRPLSMVLMGGPIDTTRSPTAVNRFSDGKTLDWFEHNMVMTVPWNHAGAGRKVYPGFLQLSGFMAMNWDKHVAAHRALYQSLVSGDEVSADKQREFYDEYLAVMDLTAEFYLQTLQRVFIDHDLPKGTYRHRGELIRPSAIKDVALLTVEGERDDISGLGQTEAAHGLCSGIPKAKKKHHVQKGVGHYGVFSGSKFRAEIAPLISQFLLKQKP